MKPNENKYYWVKLYTATKPEPMLKTDNVWLRCASNSPVDEGVIESVGGEVVEINSIASDIREMHTKYGAQRAIQYMSKETLREFLWFRTRCLQEELNETVTALEEHDADGVVDGIIDLIVFASGTLDLLGVDFQTAWDRVYTANMNKSVGVKEGRSNPLGLPDLIKNEGWVAPRHTDNVGLLNKALAQS